MDEDETWHGGRVQPWPRCVRWGPAPPKKGHTPQFLAYVYCGQMVAHLSCCWALVLQASCPCCRPTNSVKVPKALVFPSQWAYNYRCVLIIKTVITVYIYNITASYIFKKCWEMPFFYIVKCSFNSFHCQSILQISTCTCITTRNRKNIVIMTFWRFTNRIIMIIIIIIRAGHYIFILWSLSIFLSSIYLFLPRLISAVTEWMSTILLHMVWP